MEKLYKALLLTLTVVVAYQSVIIFRLMEDMAKIKQTVVSHEKQLFDAAVRLDHQGLRVAIMDAKVKVFTQDWLDMYASQSQFQPPEYPDLKE